MAPDDEDLPDYMLQRRNCDKVAPGSQTLGPELLGLCQQKNLLILNGRTLGDECGQCTFQSARGKSTVDLLRCIYTMHNCCKFTAPTNRHM